MACAVGDFVYFTAAFFLLFFRFLTSRSTTISTAAAAAAVVMRMGVVLAFWARAARKEEPWAVKTR